MKEEQTDDNDPHDVLDAFLDRFEEPPRAFAHVAFSGEPKGGAALNTTEPMSEEEEIAAELQLVALLVRSVAQDHGQPPGKVAKMAVEIIAAEDALQEMVVAQTSSNGGSTTDG